MLPLLYTLSSCSWLASVGLIDAPPPPETVVLVVLDTVRADRTSLCGHHNPTTPELEAFAAEGAAVSCATKSTGNWTLPAHATMFTGLEIPDHGAGYGEDHGRFRRGIRPLRDDVPTLAERYRERGFQTALVSANGVLGPLSGLTRGFDVHRVAEKSWRKTELDDQLGAVLDTLDPERPLFLVVNIMDAHDPWPVVPDDVHWVTDPAADKPYRPPRKAYEAGKLNKRRARWVRRRSAMRYDVGVREADRSFGRALELIRDEGWLERPWRVVVTSDHGELLGEHQRLLHSGQELYEGVVTVPLVYRTSAGVAPQFPPMLSLRAVHHLLLDGELGPVEPIRAARLSGTGEHCPDAGVATWHGDWKLHCAGGPRAWFDLSADPRERKPQPRPEGWPEADAGFLDAVVAIARDDRGRSEDGLHDALEALGYVEDDDDGVEDPDTDAQDEDGATP